MKEAERAQEARIQEGRDEIEEIKRRREPNTLMKRDRVTSTHLPTNLRMMRSPFPLKNAKDQHATKENRKQDDWGTPR